MSPHDTNVPTLSTFMAKRHNISSPLKPSQPRNLEHLKITRSTIEEQRAQQLDHQSMQTIPSVASQVVSRVSHISVQHSRPQIPPTQPAANASSGAFYADGDQEAEIDEDHPQTRFDDTDFSVADTTSVKLDERSSDSGEYARSVVPEEGHYDQLNHQHARHSSQPPYQQQHQMTYKEPQQQTQIHRIEPTHGRSQQKQGPSAVGSRFQAFHTNQKDHQIVQRATQLQHRPVVIDQNARNNQAFGQESGAFPSSDNDYSDEADSGSGKEDGRRVRNSGNENDDYSAQVNFEGTNQQTADQMDEYELRKPQTRQEETPDYTDEELKAMTYQQLKDEPMGMIPGAPKYELQPELTGLSLQEQVDIFAKHTPIDHGLDRKEYQNAHAEFYIHLTDREWDEAGDHLIAKFSEIMQSIRRAKQKKRNIIDKFEEAIEAKEKAIRGESDALEDKLKGMKAGGEDLLKNKNL